MNPYPVFVKRDYSIKEIKDSFENILLKSNEKDISIVGRVIIVRGQGIYLYPISEVIGPVDTENSYLEILKKTKGAWHNDNWEETVKARRKIELKAAKKRKELW